MNSFNYSYLLLLALVFYEASQALDAMFVLASVDEEIVGAENVERVKIKGRPKDKCRHLKLDQKAYEKCRNSFALNSTTAADEGSPATTRSSTVRKTKTSTRLAATVEHLPLARLKETRGEEEIPIEDNTPEPVSTTADFERPGIELQFTDPFAEELLKQTTPVPNANISEVESENENATIKTPESDTTDSTPELTQENVESSSAASSDSPALTDTAEPTEAPSPSPVITEEATEPPTSTDNPPTELRVTKKGVRRSTTRKPLVESGSTEIDLPVTRKGLRRSTTRKPTTTIASSSEGDLPTPPEAVKKFKKIERVNKTQEQIENEVNLANKDAEPLESFDGKFLVKCGNETHPISKIIHWMRSQNLTDEYLSDRCNADYHGSCKDIWNSCSNKAANVFCPKTCSSAGDCASLRTFGYGFDANDQPSFAFICADHPKYKCSFLRERGDCLVLNKAISKICAKTCNLCEESKPFLPYMPEHLKIVLWLHKYNDGEYAQYAEFVWRKLDVIQNKFLADKC